MSRFRIDKRVLNNVTWLFVTPALVYFGFVRGHQPSEEEKERVLVEKYGNTVQQSRENNERMQEFFRRVRSGDEGVNRQLDEVLKGGKGKFKRAHATDKDVEDFVSATPGERVDAVRAAEAERAARAAEEAARADARRAAAKAIAAAVGKHAAAVDKHAAAAKNATVAAGKDAAADAPSREAAPAAAAANSVAAAAAATPQEVASAPEPAGAGASSGQAGRGWRKYILFGSQGGP